MSVETASEGFRPKAWPVVAWGILWRAIAFGVAYGAGLGVVYGVFAPVILGLFAEGNRIGNFFTGLAFGSFFGVLLGSYYGLAWGLFIGFFAVPVWWVVGMVASALRMSRSLFGWLMALSGGAVALGVLWLRLFSVRDDFSSPVEFSHWFTTFGAIGLMAAFAFAHIGYRIAKWVKEPQTGW